MSKKRSRFRSLSLEQLETRYAPAGVSVMGGFNGLSNTGSPAPSAMVAAGPNYLVETVEGTMAIYDKATGAQVSRQSLSTLFTGFVNTGYGMFNPSVLYDDQAGRFVIAAQVVDSTNSKAYVDIAVSNSSNPTQGF